MNGNNAHTTQTLSCRVRCALKIIIWTKSEGNPYAAFSAHRWKETQMKRPVATTTTKHRRSKIFTNSNTHRYTSICTRLQGCPSRGARFLKCMPNDAVNEQLDFCFAVLDETIFFTIGFDEARRLVRRDWVETSYNLFSRKLSNLTDMQMIVGCSSRMRWLSTLWWYVYAVYISRPCAFSSNVCERRKPRQRQQKPNTKDFT